MRIVKNTEIQAILATISATINQIAVQSHFPSGKSLESWYDEIIEHCNDVLPCAFSQPYTLDKKCLVRCVCRANYNGRKNYGFDIPLWLTNKKQNSNTLNISEDLKSVRGASCNAQNKKGFKKIMLVSQDPKRETDCCGLTMSSPFGLHYLPYRNDKRKGFFTPIIQGLFDAGVEEIYITDAYKLFIEGGVTRMNRKSTKKFEAILKEEICQFCPDLIVTFSVPTRKMIESIAGLIPQNNKSLPCQYIWNIQRSHCGKQIEIYSYPYPRPLFGAAKKACEVVSDILTLNTKK